MRQQRGFTLTELLITIAILGILASLTVPRLFPQTERARAGEAITILSAIRQGEEAFRLENGVYVALGAADPDIDWNQIGMENPNNNADFFDYDVTVGAPATTFTATATRNNVNDGGNNQGTVITMDDNGDFGAADTHPFSPGN